MDASFPAPPDAECCRTLIGSLREILIRRGMFLATAESCTGGLIATLCTDVPGSSAWFAGGVVAYSNDIKQRLLGVPEDALRAHGAVSEAVVRRMALGALYACGARAATAVSGVAGPDGGTPEKPVGTVWIAHAAAEKPLDCDLLKLQEKLEGESAPVMLQAARHHFTGDRAAVRYAAAREALRGMLRMLERE